MLKSNALLVLLALTGEASRRQACMDEELDAYFCVCASS